MYSTLSEGYFQATKKTMIIFPLFNRQITFPSDPRRASGPISNSSSLSTKEPEEALLGCTVHLGGTAEPTERMPPADMSPDSSEQWLEKPATSLNYRHVKQEPGLFSLSSFPPPKTTREWESRSFQILHIKWRNPQTFAHAVPSLAMLFLKYLEESHSLLLGLSALKWLLFSEAVSNSST